MDIQREMNRIYHEVRRYGDIVEKTEWKNITGYFLSVIIEYNEKYYKFLLYNGSVQSIEQLL